MGDDALDDLARKPRCFPGGILRLRSRLFVGAVVAGLLLPRSAGAESPTDAVLSKIAEVLEERAKAQAIEAVSTLLTTDICENRVIGPQLKRTCDALENGAKLTDPTLLRTFTEEVSWMAVRDAAGSSDDRSNLLAEFIGRSITLAGRPSTRDALMQLAQDMSRGKTEEVAEKFVDQLNKSKARQQLRGALDSHLKAWCDSLKSEHNQHTRRICASYCGLDSTGRVATPCAQGPALTDHCFDAQRTIFCLYRSAFFRGPYANKELQAAKKGGGQKQALEDCEEKRELECVPRSIKGVNTRNGMTANQGFDACTTGDRCFEPAKMTPCATVYSENDPMVGACRAYQLIKLSSRLRDVECPSLPSETILRRHAYISGELPIYDDAFKLPGGAGSDGSSLREYLRDASEAYLGMDGRDIAQSRLYPAFVLRFLADSDRAINFAQTELGRWLVALRKDLDDPTLQGDRLLEGSALSRDALNPYVQSVRDDLKSILVLLVLRGNSDQAENLGKTASAMVEVAESLLDHERERTVRRLARILLKLNEVSYHLGNGHWGSVHLADSLDRVARGELATLLSESLTKKSPVCQDEWLPFIRFASAMVAAYEASSPAETEAIIDAATRDWGSRKSRFHRKGTVDVAGALGIAAGRENLGEELAVALYAPFGLMWSPTPPIGFLFYPIDVGAYVRKGTRDDRGIQELDAFRGGVTWMLRFSDTVPISIGAAADYMPDWTGGGGPELRAFGWVGVDVPLLPLK